MSFLENFPTENFSTPTTNIACLIFYLFLSNSCVSSVDKNSQMKSSFQIQLVHLLCLAFHATMASSDVHGSQKSFADNVGCSHRTRLDYVQVTCLHTKTAVSGNEIFSSMENLELIKGQQISLTLYSFSGPVCDSISFDFGFCSFVESLSSFSE